MTPQITWTVTAMDVYPQADSQTDVVFNVHWTCSASQNEFQAAVYSTQAVPYTQGAAYTPYADLTQDQVLGWIWADGVHKDATEAAVLEKLQNMINPPVITPPLPWAQGV